jgi:hypothetical protein
MAEPQISACSIQSDYVQILGGVQPRFDVGRFGGNRKINLTNFLPEYIKSTDIYEFTQFFEDYLNEMYDGVPGYSIETSGFSTTYGGSGETSGDEISATVYGYDNEIIPTSASNYNKISVLEKVYRITDLHNPDLIDVEYFQHFANYLGYDVALNKGDITSQSTEEGNRQLRFFLRNLPNWYKLKTSRNAIKTMLFSFGLVCDVVNYYTQDYINNWKLSNLSYYNGKVREDLSDINNDWYPTPHFMLWYDINRSGANLSFDVSQANQIINAIESIRPANTVFRGVQGYYKVSQSVGVNALPRYRKHVKLVSDTPANEIF